MTTGLKMPSEIVEKFINRKSILSTITQNEEQLEKKIEKTKKEIHDLELIVNDLYVIGI